MALTFFYLGLLSAIGALSLFWLIAHRRPGFSLPMLLALGVALILNDLVANGWNLQLTIGASTHQAPGILIGIPVGVVASGLMLCSGYGAEQAGQLTRNRNLMITALCAATLGLALPWLLSDPRGLLAGLAASALAVIVLTISSLSGRSRRHGSMPMFTPAWILMSASLLLAGLCHPELPTAAAMSANLVPPLLAIATLSMFFSFIYRSQAADRSLAARETERRKAAERANESLRLNEQALTLRLTERSQALESAHQRLREKDERVARLAHGDPLTGLANRVLVEDRIGHAIVRARRHNARVAVMVIDLDDFRSVNDSHGRETGDQLLIAVGARLRSSVRAEDSVARTDGNTFAILLEDVFDADDIERVVSSLRTAITTPFEIGPLALEISASIGHAFFPDGGETPAFLLESATRSMYAAKERQRLRAAAHALEMSRTSEEH